MREIIQSCDSRECRKNFKEQLTAKSDIITTLHTLDEKTKEVVCTKCGKSYKLG